MKSSNTSVDTNYIERRSAGFYFVNSRVPLDCIVRQYWKGDPAESIREQYPTLSLDQVSGGLAFYFANKVEVETGIKEREAEEDAFCKSHPIPPELKQRFERARQQNAIDKCLTA